MNHVCKMFGLWQVKQFRKTKHLHHASKMFDFDKSNILGKTHTRTMQQKMFDFAKANQTFLGWKKPYIETVWFWSYEHWKPWILMSRLLFMWNGHFPIFLYSLVFSLMHVCKKISHNLWQFQLLQRSVLPFASLTCRLWRSKNLAESLPYILQISNPFRGNI